MFLNEFRNESQKRSRRHCLSYVYTLRIIGPISYPSECDLIWFTYESTASFLTNAFCYRRMYITCTKIPNAVCKRTFTLVIFAAIFCLRDGDMISLVYKHRPAFFF